MKTSERILGRLKYMSEIFSLVFVGAIFSLSIYRNFLFYKTPELSVYAQGDDFFFPLFIINKLDALYKNNLIYFWNQTQFGYGAIYWNFLSVISLPIDLLGDEKLFFLFHKQLIAVYFFLFFIINYLIGRINSQNFRQSFLLCGLIFLLPVTYANIAYGLQNNVLLVVIFFSAIYVFQKFEMQKFPYLSLAFLVLACAIKLSSVLTALPLVIYFFVSSQQKIKPLKVLIGFPIYAVLFLFLATPDLFFSQSLNTLYSIYLNIQGQYLEMPVAQRFQMNWDQFQYLLPKASWLFILFNVAAAALVLQKRHEPAIRYRALLVSFIACVVIFVLSLLFVAFHLPGNYLYYVFPLVCVALYFYLNIMFEAAKVRRQLFQSLNVLLFGYLVFCFDAQQIYGRVFETYDEVQAIDGFTTYQKVKDLKLFKINDNVFTTGAAPIPYLEFSKVHEPHLMFSVVPDGIIPEVFSVIVINKNHYLFYSKNDCDLHFFDSLNMSKCSLSKKTFGSLKNNDRFKSIYDDENIIIYRRRDTF